MTKPSKEVLDKLKALSKYIKQGITPEEFEFLSKELKRQIQLDRLILCNKCGEDTRMESGHYGLIDCTVSGGYESKALEDLTCYTFSLCEACIKKMFDTFKIPVKIH